MKKKIVVIGWTLLGTLFVALFIIAAISVLQGGGAKVNRGQTTVSEE